MTRALLALGSNLGDRRGHLADALASMPDVVATSDVFETAPVGGPDRQGPYLNMVALLETDLSARELLGVARRLEQAASRRREVHWGPRTLDVDILWVDGETVDSDDLVVPHPRMTERAFVMIPVRDVAPDLATDWPSESAAVVRLGPLESLAHG
ncbi:MAG: 2-amino-4-hydroxy-6-hydroxymethyldihydropteridine diphosphokinase [Acidimicrobiales bacterium]